MPPHPSFPSQALPDLATYTLAKKKRKEKEKKKTTTKLTVLSCGHVSTVQRTEKHRRGAAERKAFSIHTRKKFKVRTLCNPTPSIRPRRCCTSLGKTGALDLS